MIGLPSIMVPLQIQPEVPIFRDLVVYGAFGTTSVVMLLLAVLTLRKDPKYLANITLAAAFGMIFLAMALNVVAYHFFQGQPPFLFLFKLIYVFSTASLVFIMETLLIIYKGPKFAIQKKNISIPLVMLCGCLLIPFCTLREFTPEYSLVVWTASFSTAVLSLNIIYFGTVLFVSFKLLSRLGQSVRRRFLRFLHGIILLGTAYLFIIMTLAHIIPAIFIFGPATFIMIILGGMFMYRGIIRHSTE